jgi:NAD(P)-dependent dehydrogenase (short-subunit alcohol dehydrogenase family)
MRMVDDPLTDVPTGGLSDLLILGDNVDARALQRYARSQGVEARILPAEGDADRVIAQLERIWAEGPILNLVLMTARDSLDGPLIDRQVLERRMAQGVYLPFRVAQRWVQLVSSANLNRPATIVAATSLGGDFGFESAVPSPEGGALAGLVKSIYVEDAKFDHGRFRAKVIDSPPGEDPACLAEALWREMQADRPDVEVAWADGRRRIAETVHQPVESLPRRPLRKGGVWVVTGGARGITAASALELAKRYELKLHLIGKSPPPREDAPWRNCSEDQLKTIKRSVVMKAVAEGRSPEDDWDRVRKDREIWDSLQAFAAAGVAATYHSCDVADWDSLAAVLRDIRRHHGPIQGILHGAGYAKSARLETRFGDRLVRTIAPKVDGTLALMALTADDPLEYFVAFGSLSGRFGGNGLSDYAAANDMMAKLCDWFRGWRPDCHTACFHWQTWDQIGMAILADGVGITKNAFKMDFLTPQEGIDHLHQELCAGLPAGEVLITDGFFQRAFYPASQTLPKGTSVGPSGAQRRPLIAQFEQVDGQNWKAKVEFDPVKDPFLREHTLKAKPFLPGVVGIESIVEAASMVQQGAGIFQVDNVEIVNGLAFHQQTPVATQVTVVRQGDLCRCVLSSEQRDRKGRLIDAARVHVQGDLRLSEQPAAIKADPPGRPPLGWFPHQYPDDGLLYHGPPLRSLKEVAYQYDGGWGKIVAPPLTELAGCRPAEGWLLPLSVLDACVVACGSFLYMQFGGVLEVPHAVDRLCWSRLPETGENCIVRLYFRARDDRHSRFDFTLYGREDEPLLQAIGYRTIRVGGGT